MNEVKMTKPLKWALEEQLWWGKGPPWSQLDPLLVDRLWAALFPSMIRVQLTLARSLRERRSKVGHE